MVLASALAEGVFLLGPMSYLPAYLHQSHQLSLAAASALLALYALYALYALSGLAYAVTAHHIVRRFGERRMALAGGMLMGAGFLGWLLPALAGWGFASALRRRTPQSRPPTEKRCRQSFRGSDSAAA